MQPAPGAKVRPKNKKNKTQLLFELMKTDEDDILAKINK